MFLKRKESIAPQGNGESWAKSRSYVEWSSGSTSI